MNAQKHPDQILILPTLDSFSSASGEINEFWHKRLKRLFKLQNEYIFKTLVHRYYVQRSRKNGFYVILLKFGHFTQNLEISAILLPWKCSYLSEL